MAGEDKVFADKQERRNKRKTAEEKLRLLEEQRKRTYDSVSSASMPLSIADSNASVDAGTDAHFNAQSCPMPDSHITQFEGHYRYEGVRYEGGESGKEDIV